MKSKDLRKKYLEFFKKKGHATISPASLIPENDPTTLFTSAGMQPLVPYLLGQKHPEGKRLVNSQPSLRIEDIEEVGDNRHTTFFEMLGNWSLGDYFKKEQLPWIWEFLTKELKLPKEKLYVSIFEGDRQVARDSESEEIWKSLGISPDHIFAYGIKKNWWSRSGTPDRMPSGEIGGPDSEIFYEFSEIEHDPKFGEKCHPNCECGRFLEIGNSVFLQYQKQEDGTLKELPNKNVDFGGGLERQAAAVLNEPDVFKTDLFEPIIKSIEKSSNNKYEDNKKAFRIIADHMKAASFIIGDRRGVEPSNVGQGYIARRLIRRAVRYAKSIGFPGDSYVLLIKEIVKIYKDIYCELEERENYIISVIGKEIEKFEKALEQGLKEFEKGTDPFVLYTTYGFPIELTEELAKEKGIPIDRNKFEEELKKHQELSRTASAGMFRGGLADQGEKTAEYHTATHLMLAALRKVLGNHVFQKGSNINAERLRFDFSHNEKLTSEEIKKVEDIVNEKIKENIPVVCEETDLKEAKKRGAMGVFESKYGEKVKVYTISDFSKEICGGPHAKNTGDLGRFEIIKEESSSSGVRRIKAILHKE
ncbi:MAG: alanine--tRNA ligase [Candidatus Paceibacterota bacterium]|jgi:alanyl-tRNA synthetase